MTKVFPVKISISEEYRDIVDFYTKDHSLCKLINVLLDECKKDKPFKFKILKKIEKLESKDVNYNRPSGR